MLAVVLAMLFVKLNFRLKWLFAMLSLLTVQSHHPRNQKNVYAAETSNANDRNLWTPFLPEASVPSARSVRSEGRHSEIEVKMDQSCHGEIPNLIPDRNGHMQGIRQAVPSLGGHAVRIGEINQHKAFADSSQLPGFLRRNGFFDSKVGHP